MDAHIWRTLVICILFALLKSTNSRSHQSYPLDYHSHHHKPHPKPDNTVGNYDLLIFTQAWPPTNCYVWEEKSAKHQCNLPGNEEWSIHGLWPSALGKMGPENCNSSLHFDFAALERLRPELEVKWIDVHKGAKPHEFWRHEWEKHGTCAVDLEETNTEAKYFRKGLDLLDAYDMKHVLAKAGIQLNQAYTVQNYLDGVKKILGKNAFLECVKDVHKKQKYISELRICFDKKFQLIDCNGIVQFPSNCHLQEEVIYPASVPDRIVPSVIIV